MPARVDKRHDVRDGSPPQVACQSLQTLLIFINTGEFSGIAGVGHIGPKICVENFQPTLKLFDGRCRESTDRHGCRPSADRLCLACFDRNRNPFQYLQLQPEESKRQGHHEIAGPVVTQFLGKMVIRTDHPIQ
jgi:hypothetical protein